MSDKAEKFEVAVIGKQIRVQRTLKTAYVSHPGRLHRL